MKPSPSVWTGYRERGAPRVPAPHRPGSRFVIDELLLPGGDEIVERLRRLRKCQRSRRTRRAIERPCAPDYLPVEPQMPRRVGPGRHEHGPNRVPGGGPDALGPPARIGRAQRGAASARGRCSRSGQDPDRDDGACMPAPRASLSTHRPGDGRTHRERNERYDLEVVVVVGCGATAERQRECRISGRPPDEEGPRPAARGEQQPWPPPPGAPGQS